MYAELDGHIRVTGTSAAPMIGGRFTLERGTLNVAGQSLQFTTGTVGFRVVQGVQLDNFSASRLGLPFSDTFSVTSNSQLSPNWVNQVAAPTVTGSNTVKANDALDSATVVGVNGSDVSVQAGVVTLPAGSEAGLLLRYNGSGDTSNTGYRGAVLAVSATSYTLEIFKNTGGGWVLLASQTFTATATGNTLTFSAVGSSTTDDCAVSAAAWRLGMSLVSSSTDSSSPRRPSRGFPSLAPTYSLIPTGSLASGRGLHKERAETPPLISLPSDHRPSDSIVPIFVMAAR